EHPAPAARRINDSPECCQRVGCCISTHSIERTLGRSDDHRLLALERKVQEIGGFFERCGAVKHDETAELRIFSRSLRDRIRQSDPIVGPDGARPNFTKWNGDDFGALGQSGNAFEYFGCGQFPSGFGIIDVVKLIDGEGRNRSPAADHSNTWTFLTCHLSAPDMRKAPPDVTACAARCVYKRTVLDNCYSPYEGVTDGALEPMTFVK